MPGLFGGGSATTDRKNNLAAFGSLADSMYYGQYGPGRGFIQGAGTGLGTAQDFATQLLQGQGAAMVAPQVNQIQQQAGQQRAQNAQFGSRSGGTAGFNQMIDVNTQNQIDTLIGGLVGTGLSAEMSASNALGNLGLGVTGQGIQAGSVLGELTNQAYLTTKAQQNQNLGGFLGTATSLGLAGASAAAGGGSFADILAAMAGA